MPGATCLIRDEHCGMVPVSGGFLVDEPLAALLPDTAVR